MSETGETDFSEDSGSEDSSVIRTLRQKLESAEAESARWKEQAEQAVAAEQQRRLAAVEGWVNGLDDPEQQSAVKNLIESSSDALSLVETLAAKQEDVSPAASAAQPSAGVTELGQKVFNAATGSPNLTLEERLDKAANSAEVQAIMAEAGLVDS